MLKISFSYGNYWDSPVLRAVYMIRRPRTTFADQEPASTVTFFRITRKIFKFETCHFKITARNIKAMFRENFSLLRFDSGKIFKIIIFTRGPRTRDLHAALTNWATKTLYVGSSQLYFRQKEENSTTICTFDTSWPKVSFYFHIQSISNSGAEIGSQLIIVRSFIRAIARFGRKIQRLFLTWSSCMFLLVLVCYLTAFALRSPARHSGFLWILEEM